MRRRSALVLGLCLAAGCAGADFVVPHPDMGENVAAQVELSRIRGAWDRSGPSERVQLERALAVHAQRHATDPTARTARSMLALIALERGALGRAAALAAPIALGPEGVAHDAAVVVQGAVARRQGDPAGALAKLEPLFNKIIDYPTRDVMNRELLLGAVEAKQYSRAATFLEAYLGQAAAPAKVSRLAEAKELIATFPAQPLLELLDRSKTMQSPDRGLQDLIADRLASLTLETDDVALARAVLASAGPLLGNRADAVARVAARGAVVRLERNTIGLVLPLRSPELSRRGIEVAAGLSIALELPSGPTRLLSRDDQRDASKLDETLALLNADGAAVIIAGFDVVEADAAAAYGERTGVPILLLRPPSRPVVDDGHVFVLGEDPGAARAALAKVLLERGDGPTAALVSDRDGAVPPSDGGRGVVAVQRCGASLDFVRTAGARSLIVDGDAACAQGALEAKGAARLIAFGLDAGIPRASGMFAAAGIFPIQGGSGPSNDPMLEAFRALGRGEPTWWNALGHDAGLLAKQAVAKLPAEGEESPSATAARKKLVARALGSAEATLWTTEARGLGGRRNLPRTVSVVERVEPTKAPRKR